MKSRKVLIILVIAVSIKLFLFSFAVFVQPDMMFDHDSIRYYQSAMNIVHERQFAYAEGEGPLAPEFVRTPGYPFFLALFHGYLKLPIQVVIFLQVLLTLVAAYFTYKTALLIDRRLGLVSLMIVLLDPPSSVFSLMIMTDSLFFCIMAVLMYCLALYLKTRDARHLLTSGLLIALGAYVRPVNLYLGYMIAAFVLFYSFKKAPKKAFAHAVLLLVVVYGIISLWMVRNYKLSGQVFFSQVASITLLQEGLYKSYERNTDKTSRGLPPPLYYANVSSRCLVDLFTLPATLKYFKSPLLTVIGKTVCYPWVVFWLAGFLVGLAKMKDNPYFYLFAAVIFYFTATTLLATMWGAGPRFRMPMVPFVAVICAYGWLHIQACFTAVRQAAGSEPQKVSFK